MSRPQLLALALASAVIAALAVLFVDAPLALWVAAHEQRGFWDPAVAVLEVVVGVEPFVLTVPLVLALGAIVTTASRRWYAQSRRWLYVALVYLLARNIMMWAKLFSGRLRPHQWVKAGGAMFGFVGEGASFPSGHVTLFGGLLVPLVVAVPRLRPVLVIVPFIMVARIAVQAHFVSDVCAGLALVSLVSWLLYPVLAIPLAPRRA
ncbi:MAG TPA: phosphatase PAP2 family protein [Kofleriaceae bacterium]